MTVSLWSDIVNALPGQFLRYVLPGFTCRTWSDLWQLSTYPPPATDPTSIGSGGVVPTSASLGAFTDLRDAGSGKLYLYGHRGIVNQTAGMKIMLCDRLWHAGSVLGNITTSQSVVAPPALTRPDANGVDAEIWLAIGSVGWGSTATTVTVTYTNSAGTGSRTGLISVPANNALNVGNMFPCRLQAGDLGVKSIQSLQLSPSTGTAGNATVMIIRRLAALTFQATGRPFKHDPVMNSLPSISNGAALFLMTMNDSQNQMNQSTGSIQIIEA